MVTQRVNIREGLGAEARFGTRRRVVPAMALGVIVMAVLKMLISNSALAVNFTTSDKEFKVYSNYAQGTYGAGYLGVNKGYGPTDSVGAEQLGFKTVKMAGLCLISTRSIGPIGDTSIVITAGAPIKQSFDTSHLQLVDAGGTPISLDANGRLAGNSLDNAVTVADMFMSTDAIKAYGNKFAGMNLGESADTAAAGAGLEFATGSGGAAPQSGQSGLMAERMNLAQLDGGSYGIELAGNAKLPNLRVRSVLGAATQSDCATGATP